MDAGCGSISESISRRVTGRDDRLLLWLQSQSSASIGGMLEATHKLQARSQRQSDITTQVRANGL